MRIEHFAQIDSTSLEVARRAAAKIEDGLWVQADEQTGGVGRRGRAWTSEPGNLFATGLYGHPRNDPGHAALLSFAASLAVYDVARAFIPDASVTLKWPNDVRLGGAKMAGILLQSGVTHGELWISIGVGINLIHHPKDTPYPATNLSVHMDITDPEDVPLPLPALAILAERFEHYRAIFLAQGFAPIRALWLARCEGLGQIITANLGERKIIGTFKDIGLHGELRVQGPDGTDTLITSGEVFYPT